MPRMDGTGPMGRGAMTGRGLGACNDANPVGYGQGRGSGRGFARGVGCGFGRGVGQGVGREFYNNSRTDKDFLKEQKEMLENRLDVISKELENLD